MEIVSRIYELVSGSWENARADDIIGFEPQIGDEIIEGGIDKQIWKVEGRVLSYPYNESKHVILLCTRRSATAKEANLF